MSAAVFAIGLGLLVAHSSAVAALALVAAPPIAYVLTKSQGGLALGLILVLVLPYWLTLGTAQASVLRVGSAAAAVTLLVTRRFRLTFVDCALVVLVAVIVLGWLFQYDQPHVGRVVTIELTPLGFYFGARALPQNRVQNVMSVALFAGTVGALTVLYEFLQGQPVFIDPSQYVWNATDSSVFRPGGIFGSPPGAATVLCFVILFGIAYVTNVRGWKRLLTVGCLGICSVTLVTTLTRGGIIGLSVGIVVFLWLLRSPLLRPLRVAWFAFAVGLVIFVVLPTFQHSSTFQQAVVRPGNLAARESFWKEALPIATANGHNFVFGVGTGTLETPVVANDVGVPAQLAEAPDLVQNSLHNQYVTTLFEQGAIGVGALLLFLLAALLPAARAARRTASPTHAALAASIVAVAIVMTVDTVLLHGPSFAMIMITAGLAATLSRVPPLDSAGR